MLYNASLPRHIWRRISSNSSVHWKSMAIISISQPAILKFLNMFKTLRCEAIACDGSLIACDRIAEPLTLHDIGQSPAICCDIAANRTV